MKKKKITKLLDLTKVWEDVHRMLLMNLAANYYVKAMFSQVWE